MTRVLFMSSIFDEALKMTEDAHEYFSLFGEDDKKRMTADLQSMYACEMSRITLRLSAVMAWVMSQRAVFAGRLSQQDALKYALGHEQVCMVNTKLLHGVLPSYVCFLLDRTRCLYERVQRLDMQTVVNTRKAA